MLTRESSSNLSYCGKFHSISYSPYVVGRTPQNNISCGHSRTHFFCPHAFDIGALHLTAVCKVQSPILLLKVIFYLNSWVSKNLLKEKKPVSNLLKWVTWGLWPRFFIWSPLSGLPDSIEKKIWKLTACWDYCPRGHFQPIKIFKWLYDVALFFLKILIDGEHIHLSRMTNDCSRWIDNSLNGDSNSLEKLNKIIMHSNKVNQSICKIQSKTG